MRNQYPIVSVDSKTTKEFLSCISSGEGWGEVGSGLLRWGEVGSGLFGKVFHQAPGEGIKTESND